MVNVGANLPQRSQNAELMLSDCCSSRIEQNGCIWGGLKGLIN